MVPFLKKIRNPKSEARNPKQIRNSNVQMFKTEAAWMIDYNVWDIWIFVI